MDRLQSLLKGRKPVVKDPVSVEKVNHATERARLNNEDRKYNRIVYDNELKQANLYTQTVMPNTGKDIGVSFKINVYVVKLTQLLTNKAELEKTLSNIFAQGVSVQKLRATTRETQIASDFFKKADLLSVYNELMLYIKTYAQDLISDDSFKAQIFNTSFNPLVQLLLDTSALYPAFFSQVPPPTVTRQEPRTEKADERKIYETLREQSIGSYALLNTMASFINNLIFRPIVKDDISKYISDNRVIEIFRSNSLTPTVVIPQPPVLPQPAPQQGDLQQQIQQQELLRQQQLQQQQQQATSVSTNIPTVAKDIIDRYENLKQRYMFKDEISVALNGYFQENGVDVNTIPQAIRDQLVRKIQEMVEFTLFSIGIPVGAKSTTASQVRNATQAYQQEQQQPVRPPSPPQQQGQPARSPSPQRARSPSPQQQQGQPAKAPKTSEMRNTGYETEPNEVFNRVEPFLQSTGLTQAEMGEMRAVIRNILDIVKLLENQKQEILRAKDDSDIAEVISKFRETPQAFQQFETIYGASSQRANIVREVIKAIQAERTQFTNEQAQQNQQLQGKQNTLWGLGNERNNNILSNSIYDFENLARRQANDGDLDTILELSPNLKGLEPEIRLMINKLRHERRSEPNMWGKGKYEYQQGIKKRAGMLSKIDEYSPKVEALKRGKIMSGGCDSCGLRGGMSNYEYDYSGYGGYIDEEQTPFKRFLGGMPNPFAGTPPIESNKQFMPYNSNFSDEEDEKYYNSVIPEGGSFYMELEKPYDLDANADAIRKNNENYKVFTGKQKSVKYKN
jgi:hypothetical protein